MSVVLEISGISRTFKQGPRLIKVLRGINAALEEGEVVGLMGQSGSGKSTLLQIVGLLEHPDSGDIKIDGASTCKMDDSGRTGIRREQLGFVYQFHHLLAEFSALENIMIPQRIAGVSKEDARERAEQLLADMGLAARVDHRPSQLSGGEQQRVAIARALANKPKLLLADEPTGNLDESTADKVMDQLIETVHEQKLCAFIATHNLSLASRMDRCFYLHDGRLGEK
jgi:lipoprotein-releasing system ATP-binding protein